MLAQQVTDPSLTPWFIGLGTGFAVVLVVVIIVASILTSAARISSQAQEAIEVLEAGQANTMPLWDVAKINQSVNRVLEAAQTARKALS